MADCQVRDCVRSALRGESWAADETLEPIIAFRLGMELRLTVRDVAVVLALCEEHAMELIDSAWNGVEGTLTSWAWKPLRP